ncbi:MAG: recombinase family protein [Prochlorococcus marinus CUG1432]|uniref:recombinase family protein n=1 Tax=Prochlorococcus marinus TaxID=1219 RepID=UPI001FD6E1CB|nr:recombinase family protein [Prochlorococcus marinus]MCR8544854.1 recombinase family protein [Prochlorococcus marinus CUG1432]
MTFKFKRKRLLLSEKNKNSKAIGYARATDNEYEYLEEQIKSLKKEGCSLIFSEFISLDEEVKPQLNKAVNCLSKGDQLIITQLDRAFKNKKECLRTINKLINKDIKLRTLTGFFAANESCKTNSSIYKILYELDKLEEKSLGERKKEQLLRRKLSGNNLGGRPKISPLKESLVIRLRNEGYSYRSIRSQTGIALSTIRRVILEGEFK